jgi:hypothetical protein
MAIYSVNVKSIFRALSKKKKKERRNLGHSIHNAMEDCDLQE